MMWKTPKDVNNIFGGTSEMKTLWNKFKFQGKYLIRHQGQINWQQSQGKTSIQYKNLLK